jgi:aspartate/methionine/tyrosine aminotransferase
MAVPTTFGGQVIAEAQRLRQSGLDANQIASILCKQDPEGRNYGIGILVGGDGKPMPTSPTLLDHVNRELQNSGKGVYLNSDAVMAPLTEAVLRWQGVPEPLWRNFQLLLPSDAGTGAVQTAVQAAILLNEGLKALAVETLGWPAYRPIAVSTRMQFKEFPSDETAQGDGVLPLYQAGPLNTTGRVASAEVVQRRARAAAAAGVPVILDRAYSGFEYAREAGRTPYMQLMANSFRAQVQPFVEAGVPVALAISPTKAFRAFALRPCGLLLIYQAEAAKASATAPKLAGLIRARGSSFEHVVTRAFARAMIEDRARLEAEHAEALDRCAQAERLWQRLAKGTPMEPLFTEHYAGLFRNPAAKPGAAVELYGDHLYPVLSEGRCRLNVTGLPADEERAEQEVSRLAACCA